MNSRRLDAGLRFVAAPICMEPNWNFFIFCVSLAIWRVVSWQQRKSVSNTRGSAFVWQAWPMSPIARARQHPIELGLRTLRRRMCARCSKDAKCQGQGSVDRDGAEVARACEEARRKGGGAKFLTTVSAGSSDHRCIGAGCSPGCQPRNADPPR
jgi:hypothetical protein